MVTRLPPGSGIDLVALVHDQAAFQAVTSAVELFEAAGLSK